jgi:hypothetical protein
VKEYLTVPVLQQKYESCGKNSKQSDSSAEDCDIIDEWQNLGITTNTI